MGEFFGVEDFAGVVKDGAELGDAVVAGEVRVVWVARSCVAVSLTSSAW